MLTVLYNIESEHLLEAKAENEIFCVIVRQLTIVNSSRGNFRFLEVYYYFYYYYFRFDVEPSNYQNCNSS